MPFSFFGNAWPSTQQSPSIFYCHGPTLVLKLEIVDIFSLGAAVLLQAHSPNVSNPRNYVTAT